MEAAKKADHEFELTPPSTRHTTRDSSVDVRKVLLENGIPAPQTSCITSPFRDVTKDGFAKISQTWLKQVLKPAPDTEETSSIEYQNLHGNTSHFDYEL